MPADVIHLSERVILLPHTGLCIALPLTRGYVRGMCRERVSSSPRDAAAVAMRMEQKTLGGISTASHSMSHRAHVYIDGVLSNARRMSPAW